MKINNIDSKYKDGNRKYKPKGNQIDIFWWKWFYNKLDKMGMLTHRLVLKEHPNENRQNSKT